MIQLGFQLERLSAEVGGQAVLGRQDASPTPWLTERHGYDPTWEMSTLFEKIVLMPEPVKFSLAVAE